MYHNLCWSILNLYDGEHTPIKTHLVSIRHFIFSEVRVCRTLNISTKESRWKGNVLDLDICLWKYSYYACLLKSRRKMTAITLNSMKHDIADQSKQFLTSLSHCSLKETMHIFTYLVKFVPGKIWHWLKIISVKGTYEANLPSHQSGWNAQEK